MILRTSKHKGESAHSLPEAIIAALVVGTMLVSLYAGFSSGFTIVQSAREELRATQIILARMESIRLYTWSQLHDTNNFLKPTFVPRLRRFLPRRATGTQGFDHALEWCLELRVIPRPAGEIGGQTRREMLLLPIPPFPIPARGDSRSSSTG